MSLNVGSSTPFQPQIPQKTNTAPVTQSAPVEVTQEVQTPQPPPKSEGPKEPQKTQEQVKSLTAEVVKALDTSLNNKEVNTAKTSGITDITSELADELDKTDEEDFKETNEQRSDLEGAKKKDGKIGQTAPTDSQNGGNSLMVGKQQKKDPQQQNQDGLIGGSDASKGEDYNAMAVMTQVDDEMDANNSKELQQKEREAEEANMRQEVLKNQSKQQSTQMAQLTDKSLQVQEKSLQSKVESQRGLESPKPVQTTEASDKAKEKENEEDSVVSEMHEDSQEESTRLVSSKVGTESQKQQVSKKENPMNNPLQEIPAPVKGEEEPGKEEGAVDLNKELSEEHEDEAQEDLAHAQMLKSSEKAGMEQQKREITKIKKPLKEAVEDLKTILKTVPDTQFSQDDKLKIGNAVDNLVKSPKFAALTDSVKDQLLTFLSGITTPSLPMSSGDPEAAVNIGDLNSKAFVAMVGYLSDELGTGNEIAPKFKLPSPMPEVEALFTFDRGGEPEINTDMMSQAIREIMKSFPASDEIKPKLVVNPDNNNTPLESREPVKVNSPQMIADFTNGMLEGKASKAEKAILTSFINENASSMSPKEVQTKITAFENIVNSSDIFKGNPELRETTLKAVFNHPGKSVDDMKALVKTVTETAKIFPDAGELKGMLTSVKGDNLDAIKGRILFTASIHLETGLTSVADCAKLVSSGVITKDDFLKAAVMAAEHAIDTNHLERAKGITDGLGDVDPSTKLKLDFLVLKAEISSNQVELRNELTSKHAPKQLDKSSVLLKQISGNDIHNRIMDMQMKLVAINDLEEKVAPDNRELRDKIKSFRTNVISDLFKSSMVFAANEPVKGPQLIKDIKAFYTKDLGQKVTNLTNTLFLVDKEADKLQSKLEVSLQKNRSTGDKLKGFFMTSHDMSKAFATIKSSESALKDLYAQFKEVSGATGEVRSSFKQKLPFTRKQNDAEKAVEISNKIKEHEAKLLSSLNVISNEAKSASTEDLSTLKEFISLKNESFNLRTELNTFKNFAKNDIADMGTLTRQVTEIQKSRATASIGHSKTNTGAYLEMKEKLAPLSNMMPGQSIVVSHKGFVGAGTDLPLGGNALLKADGNVYVASEMRVTRLDDGRIKVTQNTREGVEAKGKAAVKFEAGGHIGAIQQREVIFPNLDTAVRELANLKGILPSESEVEKVSGLEKGVKTKDLSGTRESSNYNVKTYKKDETGQTVMQEKTRWIQSFSNTDTSIASKLEGIKLMTKTSTASTAISEGLQAVTDINSDSALLTVGHSTGMNYRVDIRFEAEKVSDGNDTFKLRDTGSKADFQFKLEDIIELRGMKPSERESSIKDKAQVLANMFHRSLERCDIGTKEGVDCKVGQEQMTEVLHSIENSIRYILDNDSVLAKAVRETDDLDISRFETDASVNVLTSAAKDQIKVDVADLASQVGDKFSGGGESTSLSSIGDKAVDLASKTGKAFESLPSKSLESARDSFVKAAKNEDGIGFGVNIKYDKSTAFNISLPFTQDESGSLKIGPSKVGIKGQTDKGLTVKVSKVVPFVEFHGGYENSNQKVSVMAVVGQSSQQSTSQFIKIPLGIGEKLKDKVGMGDFNKPVQNPVPQT